MTKRLKNNNIFSDKFKKKLQSIEVENISKLTPEEIKNLVLGLQIQQIELDAYKHDLEKKVRERTQELARANRQLEQYSRRVTQVQEEERKRISYELYDGVAQYLSILKLHLDAIVHSDTIRDSGILDKFDYLQKDISQAIDDVSRYSRELRSDVLDNLGLQAALEQLTEDINNLKQVSLELLVEGQEPELSGEIKLNFFRIAQEALNNVCRHSGATRATINLQFEEKRLKISVSDNGAGFDVQEVAAQSSQKGTLGFMSMQERAKLIGASLKIDSQLDNGTTITLESKL